MIDIVTKTTTVGEAIEHIAEAYHAAGLIMDIADDAGEQRAADLAEKLRLAIAELFGEIHEERAYLLVTQEFARGLVSLPEGSAIDVSKTEE